MLDHPKPLLYHVGVHEQLKNANQTTRACARRLVYGAKAEAAIAIGFDDYDFRCIASHEPVAVKRSHEPPSTVEGASSASTVEVDTTNLSHPAQTTTNPDLH
ncbi:hypothetical protein JHK87_024333 [Glycine soja]|nr:hypothetical protein JHK87_024333 [Glycine soja]